MGNKNDIYILAVAKTNCVIGIIQSTNEECCIGHKRKYSDID